MPLCRPGRQGISGQDIRQPQVLSVSFTSTLSSSLVNEARFGLSRTGANTGGAAEPRGYRRGSVGSSFPRWAARPFCRKSRVPEYGLWLWRSRALPTSSHEVSPRWIYADTVSWTRGAHAFKFGGEYRLSSTKSTNRRQRPDGLQPSSGHPSATRRWPQSTVSAGPGWPVRRRQLETSRLRKTC